MAGRLTPLGQTFLALALNAITMSAYGQVPLADPTRPPVGVIATEPADGNVSSFVLQSVKIPKKGKPVALIGGQQVKLGESIGELRLIQLTEREAVLQGPDGVERLQLTPGIEKTNITKKSPTAKPAQRGGKP